MRLYDTLLVAAISHYLVPYSAVSIRTKELFFARVLVGMWLILRNTPNFPVRMPLALAANLLRSGGNCFLEGRRLDWVLIHLHR